jgi:hypothetical protein
LAADGQGAEGASVSQQTADETEESTAGSEPGDNDME